MYVSLGGVLLMVALVFVLLYCMCFRKKNLGSEEECSPGAGPSGNDQSQEGWSNYATFSPSSGGGQGVWTISGDRTIAPPSADLALPKYEELFPHEEEEQAPKYEEGNGEEGQRQESTPPSSTSVAIEVPTGADARQESAGGEGASAVTSGAGSDQVFTTVSLDDSSPTTATP